MLFRSPFDIPLEYLDLHTFFAECEEGAFKPHIHGFYQIIWFKKGNGVHFVDFKEYPICENTIFFISPGQLHYFDRNISFEGIIIHFNESFLADESGSENIFLKYNVFHAFDSSPYSIIPQSHIDRLQTLANEMQEELSHTDAFAYQDYLKCLVKMFLIHIQRNGKQDSAISLNINNHANRMFVQFRQALEHHYHELHTVKAYADLLHISAKSLTNYVYICTRSTPLKIINERIILEARRLLTHSGLKIKEISYQLGFEDPSYFVKFFKRQTGYLPAQIRKQTNS